MRTAIRRAVLMVAMAAAAAIPAYADGVGVTLVANTSFGSGIQYTDVYYHNGLAFIGTWTGPGRIFIADAASGAHVGTYQTSNNSIIRDMQVQGTTLFVALDSAGIDIVDISNPAAPAFVTRHNTTLAGVHDLFIHGNTLYYVDDTASSRLHIVNVANRAAPTHITTFVNSGGCHDITLVGNRAYLANLGGGFQIVDVTNPATPTLLGSKNYSGSFTHNIWPSGDGRYVATTDETCGTGHLRIWDVQNPSNIFQVGEYSAPTSSGTCVHNAMWVDNYIYMSYYTKGLRVVDVTNPAMPVEIAHYETLPTLSRGGTYTAHDDENEANVCFDGAWGIYAERIGADDVRIFVSDIQSGLWIFEAQEHSNLATDGIGVYSAATGTYFLRDTNTPGAADAVYSFGAGGNVVGLSGDWDGNGTKTPGFYDQATGTFFLRNSNTPGAADLFFTFGAGGQGFQPLVGDWDGNDTETIGLYSPVTGTFFLRNSNTPGAADLFFTFGAGGTAIAVAGDWDDTDTDTVGIYLPESGTFFLRNANSGGAADAVFSFGPGGAGFRPVVGNWDGVAGDTIGVYDPATATFFLKNSNAPGAADLFFSYGPPNMTPLSGDWRGPGL
jgi:choice-of-anchor B domain-containing protein